MEATLDRQWLANEKKQIKRDNELFGHDFEAVVTFKQYCDKKDNYYVYKINDRRGNPDRPSFVFKMGTQKAKMAINMDKDGNHFMKEVWFFLMAKENAVEVLSLSRQVYITAYYKNKFLLL